MSCACLVLVHSAAVIHNVLPRSFDNLHLHIHHGCKWPTVQALYSLCGQMSITARFMSCHSDSAAIVESLIEQLLSTDSTGRMEHASGLGWTACTPTTFTGEFSPFVFVFLVATRGKLAGSTPCHLCMPGVTHATKAGTAHQVSHAKGIARPSRTLHNSQVVRVPVHM